MVGLVFNRNVDYTYESLLINIKHLAVQQYCVWHLV